MELFLTAFIALVLSFLIAKIVSLATGAGASVSGVDGKPVTDADDAIIMQDLEFAHKLKAQRTESERKLIWLRKAVIIRLIFEPEQAGFDDQGFESEKKVEESSEKVDQFEAGLKVEGFESGKEVEFVQETAKKSMILKPNKLRSMKSNEGARREEKKVKIENDVGDDDDDDWEEIDKSELEKVFGAAAKYIEHNGDLGTSNDFQMELYGLHKIATEGPCREPQPLAFMASSRSKWNAWQTLGNMNPEAAMEKYVTLLSDKVPGWMEENSDGERNFRSADGGVPGSIAPDKQAIFMYERNTCLNSTSRGGDITESTSFEKQAKD
ncbi:Detected protein of unknown function [Hibiscus syriacus]|uniref:ACB domain-containing protein n=1 Tax=Hibiscus syriacus TaxID=106335 RepID=A0A6A2YVL2_HIBSY|nr:Detected protein of unknown function [Hibiscus syriacus]